MSETVTENPNDDSPEGIAHRLMILIADLEHKTLHGNPAKDRIHADRQWVLDTYAECLRAIRTPEQRKD